MAFAAKESKENVGFKKYIGIAPVKVLAVNPTKAELESIYNTTFDKDPEYISETNVGTAEAPKMVKQLRLDFILQTVEDKCSIDTIIKSSFFLTNSYRFNTDKSKIQVINKYGETAYITQEQFKTKNLSENMQWFDTTDIRPAYIGEDNLVSALKTFLCVPAKSWKTATGEIKIIENLADAEAKLEKIPEYFKGDIKEISNLIKLMPNNIVKVLIGIRTTDDNKQYQDIFKEMWIKNSVTNYSYLEKTLKSKKDSGSYSNTEFRIIPIEEYKVESTSFNSESNNVAPVSSPWGVVDTTEEDVEKMFSAPEL